MNEEPVWSVSEVNQAVRDMVENSLMPFWLGAEVGTMNIYASGHVYLTLKDARCQLRAVYFNGAREVRAMKLQQGDRIEAHGKLSVYEVRGEYQFTIRQMRPVGLGDLQRRFELLKNKLNEEGLFAPERKKPIPLLPSRIGVVTSPEGAAIRDFLQILERRFPNVQIRIYPSPVQGEGAARQLAAGVEFFNRTGGVDVIVVTRGGGSMEDLWPFNEEILARAIAACRIPVISAVGHEIDYTIADFVADLRVPTPSAAAELVIGNREELTGRLERSEKNLLRILRERHREARHRLELAASSYVFREPAHLLRTYQQRMDELEWRGRQLLERRSRDAAGKFETLHARLQALNPKAVLARGFALLLDPATGKPVTSVLQAIPGEKLNAQLADGMVPVTVDLS